MEPKPTTIKINPEIKKELDAFKTSGESYQTIINQLIKENKTLNERLTELKEHDQLKKDYINHLKEYEAQEYKIDYLECILNETYETNKATNEHLKYFIEIHFILMDYETDEISTETAINKLLNLDDDTKNYNYIASLNYFFNDNKHKRNPRNNNREILENVLKQLSDKYKEYLI